MALEDIKRNARKDIENDINNFLKEKSNKANHKYALSKIDLATRAKLLTIEETKKYILQLGYIK